MKISPQNLLGLILINIFLDEKTHKCLMFPYLQIYLAYCLIKLTTCCIKCSKVKV